MNITEFFSANGGPVAFNVDGLDGPLYCKVLSYGDVSTMFRELKGDGIETALVMLARCVVDSSGKPLKSVDEWKAIPATHRKTLESIAKEVQRINGLITSEEVVAAGKP